MTIRQTHEEGASSYCFIIHFLHIKSVKVDVKLLSTCFHYQYIVASCETQRPSRMPLLILSLTEGSVSPFLAFFTFTLLAATLRWDWPGVLATAIVLVVVLLAVSIQASSSPTVPEIADFDWNRAIIRAAFLMVAGAMLAYV